jgi:hypothetical protein
MLESRRGLFFPGEGLLETADFESNRQMGIIKLRESGFVGDAPLLTHWDMMLGPASRHWWLARQK